MTFTDTALPAGIAAPQDINGRVNRLINAGHQWLPVQTLYALADSGLSDSEITSTAENMRQAALTTSAGAAITGALSNRQKQTAQGAVPSVLQQNQSGALGQLASGVRTAHQATTQADDGFKVFWDDPVLQKHPSAALALKTYLSGAIGSAPLADADLGHVQQQLQIQGFGRELKADGAWNSGWSAAQQQWKDAIYNKQLSGEKPGGISVGHALEALQALTPTSAFNALIGFVTHLPDGARQLVGDLAGGISGASYMLTQEPRVPFFSEQSKGEAEHFGRASADTVNALGGDATAQGETQAIQHNAGLRILEDASNIIMLSQTLGAAGRFADAVGVERAAAAADGGAALSAEAAYRGPGVIARSLAGAPARTAAGAITGAAATAAAGGTGFQIGLGGLAGGALGGLSTTNAFQNIPVLGRTGPVIDSLLDENGLYYKARRLVAAPYNLSAVRLGDTALNQELLLGAEARGLAQAQDTVGGNQSTGFSKAVEGTHTLDTVNDAIKHRLEFTALGAHITPSLDDLQFMFAGHGASALGQNASKQVGENIDAIKNSLEGVLGRQGTEAAISHVTGMSRAQLVEAAGGEANYQTFWTNKLKELAVSHMAEDQRLRELGTTGVPTEESVADLTRTADLQAKEHAILQDPDQVKAAIKQLTAQYGGDEIIVRLQRQITNSRLSPNEYAQGIQPYLQAVTEAKQNLVPHASSFLEGERELANNKVLINGGSEPGQFGLASTGTLTRVPALHKANVLEDEFNHILADVQARNEVLTAAATNGHPNPPSADLVNAATSGPFPEQKLGDWNDKMARALHEDFGVQSQYMPHRGQEMIDAYKEMANHLAVDVQVHPDAPQELHDAVARINSLGYKPVSGTDIGWIMHDTTPMEVLNGPLTQRRKTAEMLGLSPTVVADRTIAATRRDGIRNAIQDGIDKGTIKLPPFWSPDTVLAHLEAEGVLPSSSGPFKEAIQGLLRTPQRVAKNEGYRLADGSLDINKARDELNQALQLRDYKRADVVEALTNPDKVWSRHEQSAESAALQQTKAQGTNFLDQQVAPMSEDSAQAIFDAIRKGSAAPPGYMLGASRIEDLARASMGFAGKGIGYRMGAAGLLGAGLGASVAAANDQDIWKGALAGGTGGAALAAMGGDRLGWALANLPNRLTQLRNEFRFELSPFFSFRRMAKINVKLPLEGVEPTLNPLRAMQDAGTLERDRATLAEVRPALYNSVSDDADRYLQSQDVFGLYNHRNYEAYAAGKWKEQGLSNDEINQKLVKVFEYGSKGVAGRSALERSTNFVFFPFSFDKTLYRNLGGYLLDNPAQRMLLSRGMAAYDEFNRTHMDGTNPLATSFWTQHAPLMTEVEQLNAFTHGISLGEPGGINRPLLNMFLPQSWQSSDANLSTLKRFVPIVKDFARIYTESLDQKSILQATGENMWRDLQGIPATYTDPVASTQTQKGQMSEAFAMQRNWFDSYKSVLDYNSSTRDKTQQVSFPASPEWGKWSGEPITKQAIRDIIHVKYPSYSPTGAVAVAVSRNDKFQQYLLDTKGTPLHDYVRDFADNATKLGRAMNSDNFSAQEVSTYTAGLRQQAVYIAQHDPAFYKMYAKSFGNILGPLEAVKQ